jgi:nucleoside-diphosphate-sugar epimerase
MTRSVALVTGASGFLGGHLASALAEGDWIVRGGVQNKREYASWNRPGVKPIFADLLNLESLRLAVRGASIVFHCAALIPGKGNEDDIWEVNVDGTKNLLDACVKEGVGRILYVSTDSVYGDRYPVSANEQTPINPIFFSEGNYPLSKWEGECQVMEYHQRGDIKATIVRPCLMYGPRWSTGTEIMSRLAERRIHRFVANGNASWSVGYVENIVRGILLAGTNPVAVGEVYNLSDELPQSMRQMIRTLCHVTGRRCIAIPIPTRPWLAACKVMHPLVKKLTSQLAERVDPELVKFLSTDHVISIQKAKSQLGYQPDINFEEGCRRMFEWRDQFTPVL